MHYKVGMKIIYTNNRNSKRSFINQKSTYYKEVYDIEMQLYNNNRQNIGNYLKGRAVCLRVHCSRIGCAVDVKLAARDNGNDRGLFFFFILFGYFLIATEP